MRSIGKWKTQNLFREIHQEILNLSKKQEIKKKESKNHVKNRGTDDGGSKTNQHGLPYERLTNLSTHYHVLQEHPHYQQICIKNIPLV